MVPTEAVCADCGGPRQQGCIDDGNLCDECQERIKAQIRNTAPESVVIANPKALERTLNRKGPPDYTVTEVGLDCGKNYFIVTWGTVSAGFGELTFYKKDGKIKVDTEAMGNRFCKEVLAKLVDTASPPEPNTKHHSTEKPKPYGHYEGHDLSRAEMDTIWSVGATPRDAIEALCRARWGGTLEKLGEPLTGGDPSYTWGYRFVSDNGTGFKAGGVEVPGGVICTWWK